MNSKEDNIRKLVHQKLKKMNLNYDFLIPSNMRRQFIFKRFSPVLNAKRTSLQYHYEKVQLEESTLN